MPRPDPSAPALRIIILYKLARAALALTAAITLALLTATGHSASLQTAADTLALHLATHASSELAQTLVAAVTPRHLWLAVTALTLDGMLVLLEGWSLYRGYAWGAWLVVMSTAALLPFEATGLWHHPHLGRALLLLGNLCVALYLARRVWRERGSAGVSRPNRDTPTQPTR